MILAATLGALLAIAAPYRNGASATLGIKLAREESELPICRNVRRIIGE